MGSSKSAPRQAALSARTCVRDGMIGRERSATGGPTGDRQSGDPPQATAASGSGGDRNERSASAITRADRHERFDWAVPRQASVAGIATNDPRRRLRGRLTRAIRHERLDWSVPRQAVRGKGQRRGSRGAIRVGDREERSASAIARSDPRRRSRGDSGGRSAASGSTGPFRGKLSAASYPRRAVRGELSAASCPRRAIRNGPCARTDEGAHCSN
jgi:hypothetical protein